jgi:threonine/homoserine/homoserine lactone efflux protein
MAYGPFLLQAVLISLSGVMAPGPLTAVVVGKGARSARAGAAIAVGHGIVEFPLMALLVVGLAPFFTHPVFAAWVGLAGGLVLLWMGVDLVRTMRRPAANGPARRETSALMAGVLMTAGNPYFLVWWATVGATLVLRAWGFGLWRFALFAVIHWSLDLVWYFFLSAASHRGTRLLGDRFRVGVSLASGALLLYFGVRFVADAAETLL